MISFTKPQLIRSLPRSANSFVCCKYCNYNFLHSDNWRHQVNSKLTDPSPRQGGRPMTNKTVIVWLQIKMWWRVPNGAPHQVDWLKVSRHVTWTASERVFCCFAFGNSCVCKRPSTILQRREGETRTNVRLRVMRKLKTSAWSLYDPYHYHYIVKRMELLCNK